MFEPLRCPDCPWKSRPKHKRPQQALTQHRQRAHPNGVTADKPGLAHLPVTHLVGYLVTLASGEEIHVPADECQETMDRYWFFRTGGLKETFKRTEVREVVKV